MRLQGLLVRGLQSLEEVLCLPTEVSVKAPVTPAGAGSRAITDLRNSGTALQKQEELAKKRMLLKLHMDVSPRKVHTRPRADADLQHYCDCTG